MKIQRKKYLKYIKERKNYSSIKIQKIWRGYNNRKKYKTLKEYPNKCAIKIQSLWRKRKAKKDVNEKRKKIIEYIISEIDNLIKTDYNNW